MYSSPSQPMFSHVAQKHVESGSTLLEAFSLPYEKFGQVSNPGRVPAPLQLLRHN